MVGAGNTNCYEMVQIDWFAQIHFKIRWSSKYFKDSMLEGGVENQLNAFTAETFYIVIIFALSFQGDQGDWKPSYRIRLLRGRRQQRPRTSIYMSQPLPQLVVNISPLEIVFSVFFRFVFSAEEGVKVRAGSDWVWDAQFVTWQEPDSAAWPWTQPQHKHKHNFTIT